MSALAKQSPWIGRTRIAAAVLWISCLALLLPSPWHWADEAERMLEHTYALQVERAAKAGAGTPHAPTASAVAETRRAAWIEWSWLLIAIVAGISAALQRSRKAGTWAIALVATAAVYVACRWYFAPSSYGELLRALFDAGARSGQIYLAKWVPLAYAELTYYNVIVPIGLVVLAAVRLRAG